MTAPLKLSRLAALKAGKAAILTVPYPGIPADQPVFLVGIKPLSAADLQDSGLAAAMLVQRWPEHVALRRHASDGFDRELTYQLLQRCLVDPETGEPFATSVEQLKELMTFGEAEQLAEQATSWQEFASPDLNAVEDLERLATELGKTGPSATRSAGPPRTGNPPAFSGGPVPSSQMDSCSGSTSGDGSTTALPDNDGE